MKTKLYLPYTDYKINDKQGEQILLEALIANGPAYKIVAHENDEWHRIQDEDILSGDWIEIITKEEAEKIKEEVEMFFIPAIEGMMVDDPNYDFPVPADNIIYGLKKALSYIMIANKKKAWIYGDEIIEDAKNDVRWFKINKKHIDPEGYDRTIAFNDFIESYESNNLNHLSMIHNPNISHDFFDLVDDTLVKDLSEKGFNFGALGHKYNILERDIKQTVTDIIQSKKIPYLIRGAGILASCHGDPSVGSFISSLGIISHKLRNVDVTYSPP